MKPNLLSRQVFKFTAFMLMFYLGQFGLSAQCPTVDTPSISICSDGPGYTFKNLDAFVSDAGNGIAWFDAPVGGSSFNPNELVTEGTYYAGDITGNCGTRSSIVIDFLVNETGQTLDRIYCSKENATFQNYINDVLQSFIPTGGGVQIYSDLELTTPINPTDVIPVSVDTYFMVLNNASNCRSQIERGQIGVFETPPDPNPESNQVFCSNSNPTVNDLDADTGLFFNWYESLDSDGNPILPALLPTDPLVSGNTYYLQIEGVFCSSNPIPISVEINTAQSGTSGTLLYCENNIPSSTINLFDALGDPKDNSGTWTGPITTSNRHLGTIDITVLPLGDNIFTYTVESDVTCPDIISEITITIDAPLSSGTPVSASPSTFCEASLPVNFDLSAQLTNQDIGGQWTTGSTSAGPVITSTVDLSTYTTGTYFFTYTQNLPPSMCNMESTTIQVDILSTPEAGNAINQLFCENELVDNSPFDLFNALDGTQSNNNGVWTDASDNTISNILEISAFTASIGTYSFNYTIGSGDCSDIETITINVDEGPESGTINTPITFCEGDAPTNFDLFDLLTDETQTGIWYLGTDTSGSTVTTPIDLSSFTVGTYNFTYDVDAIGNCDDELVTGQVIINALPNAGTALDAIFCETELNTNSPLELFDFLNGEELGGTWTDDNTTGALTGSEVNLVNLNIGVYNFTYTILDTNGCTDSETVVVSVNEAPKSGTVNTPITFCEGDAPSNFDLFDLLTDETQTGIWYLGTDISGRTVTNPIDLSSFAVGIYNFTYDVDAIGNCDDELVTGQVIINALPNVGMALDAIFCETELNTNSPLELFDFLSGAEAGGTWSDDNTTGALTGSALNLTNLNIGVYNFTYTILDTNGCTDSETVVVSVNEAPKSGTVNTPISFCEGDASSNFDLYDLLTGETQSGTWYLGTDTSGSTVTNPIDLSSFAIGTYNFTYDVDTIGNCDDELVTGQIIINPLPNAGVSSAATFCESELDANSPLELFDFLSGADAGGTWSDDDTSGALSGSEVNLATLVVGTYNFTYTIVNSNNCTASETVQVSISETPSSGTANSPAEFCLSQVTTGETYNLFDGLTGETQDGIWLDDDASGALNGNQVSLDVLPEGTYSFTYDVNTIGNCDDENVTVNVIIQDVEAPTAEISQDFCDAAIISDLQATGQQIRWYDAEIGGNVLDATSVLVNGNTYYASQISTTNNCESSNRVAVTVNIYNAPNAGKPSDERLVACNNIEIDLFTALDGSQDTGGVWQNIDGIGSLNGNLLDTSGVLAGSYEFNYTVAGTAPCVDDITSVTITIEEPLNAGSNNTIDICSDNGEIDLFTLLGAADTGGTWTPELNSGTNLFNPLQDEGGTYTYSLSNSCGTESSEIIVNVSQSPNAGMDSSVTICVSNGTLDLFDLLGADAQLGGTWSPQLDSGSGIFDPSIDTAGSYVYTVTADAPCNPEDSAEIEVTIEDADPVTIINTNPAFCQSENPTVLDLEASIEITGTSNWYEDEDLTLPLSEDVALIDGEDYYVTQTNAGGCESSIVMKIEVTINDVPAPTFNTASLEFCINDEPTLEDLLGSISESDSTEYLPIWYDASTDGNELENTDLLTDTTYYLALYDADLGCESSTRLEVTPDLTACGKLEIPDGFSPNGDGVNDTLDIDNLGFLYPNFNLEIYNRYGNIVYKGGANTPRFDGTANQSKALFQGDLPVGVYFYIFDFNDGENEPEQGRIYLSR